MYNFPAEKKDDERQQCNLDRVCKEVCSCPLLLQGLCQHVRGTECRATTSVAKKNAICVVSPSWGSLHLCCSSPPWLRPPLLHLLGSICSPITRAGPRQKWSHTDHMGSLQDWCDLPVGCVYIFTHTSHTYIYFHVQTHLELRWLLNLPITWITWDHCKHGVISPWTSVYSCAHKSCNTINHTRWVCVITLGVIHVPLPAWCDLPLRSVYTYLPVSCMNIHTYPYIWSFTQIRLQVTVAVKFTHLIDALQCIEPFYTNMDHKGVFGF